MPADLSKFTTRQLLAALDQVRIDKSQVEKIHRDRATLGEPWMWEWTKEHWQGQSFTGYLGPEVSAAELKAELAKREHIPNAKEARRERAKRGRQKGRRDR